jgi:hypothetical protein
MNKTQMTEVTTKEWENLLSDTGTFFLSTETVDSLKKNLKDCYDEIQKCKGDRTAFLKLPEKEYGNFSVYLPPPGLTEGPELHIIYKVPEDDIVRNENEWSLVHGSETQFVSAWLKKHTKNPLISLFKTRTNVEECKEHSEDSVSKFWPFFMKRYTTNSEDQMEMYFQLVFNTK